jgi:hypothetical protein
MIEPRGTLGAFSLPTQSAWFVAVTKPGTKFPVKESQYFYTEQGAIDALPAVVAKLNPGETAYVTECFI